MALRSLGPILVVLLLLAAIARAPILFLLFWFLLGLYSLPRLWACHAAHHVQIHRSCEDRAFAGETLTVTLSITNTGRIPIPYLDIRDQLPVQLTPALSPEYVLSLGGRQEQHIRYTFTCNARGYFALGPVEGQTGDPFNVSRRKLPPAAEGRLIVYPRIVPLQRLGLPTRSSLSAIPAPASLLPDTSRIVAIREYRPGDSPRALHWGATARFGQLMVKQYQPAISRSTMLCLNLDYGAYPVRGREAMERAIVVAASLASHLVGKERLPVGLVASGSQTSAADGRIALPPHDDPAYLTSILEVLAGIGPRSEAAFAPLLREESLRWMRGTTVTVITGRVDPELEEVLLTLWRRGFAVAVLLIRPPAARSGLAALPPSISVRYVWVDAEVAA